MICNKILSINFFPLIGKSIFIFKKIRFYSCMKLVIMSKWFDGIRSLDKNILNEWELFECTTLIELAFASVASLTTMWLRTQLVKSIILFIWLCEFYIFQIIFFFSFRRCRDTALSLHRFRPFVASSKSISIGCRIVIQCPNTKSNVNLYSMEIHLLIYIEILLFGWPTAWWECTNATVHES